MINANAYAIMKPTEAFKPFQVARREVKANDILIDVSYCGVCHSDIHMARNEWGSTLYPIVPGHEIVGKVSKIGAAVTRFKVGENVGVGCFVDSCRKCYSCKQGIEQYCDEGMTQTYNSNERDSNTITYGGYSTQIVVNDDYVLKIPANLPLEKVAPLLCAGITTYSPLRQWKVKKDDKVGIIGLGGLGHMGVKIAAAMGAEVTVFSSSNKKKEDALRFGAKHYINSSNNEEFKNHLNRYDVIINTVASDMDLTQYLSLLKLDGTMVQVGVPEKANSVHAFPLILRRRRLAGSLIGGIKETQEMLDFCGKNNITSEIELISIHKLEDAYERMIRGDVRYRFVIDINSLR